jgi:hypothetical protein
MLSDTGDAGNGSPFASALIDDNVIKLAVPAATPKNPRRETDFSMVSPPPKFVESGATCLVGTVVGCRLA